LFTSVSGWIFVTNRKPSTQLLEGTNKMGGELVIVHDFGPEYTGKPAPIPRKHPPNWTPSPRWIDVFKGRDDEKVLFKTLLMSKYTGAGAAFFSIADIMLLAQSQTITAALQRILTWSVPMVGGGIAYTTTVCIASSLRGKKEDTWNHFFGGAMSGAVIGAARKSVIAGSLAGLFFGLYGAVHKDCVLQGVELWPDLSTKHTMWGWSLSHKQDMTVTAKRPGYWVRSKDDPPPPPEANPPANALTDYSVW
jgi:hypothetical protein